MGEKQSNPTPNGASGATWGVILLDVPAALEDELVGGLASCSLGAAVEAGGPGVRRLRIYVESGSVARAGLRVMADHLRRCGLDPHGCGLRAESVEDGHWVERYQASLRPFPLGARFTVIPAGPAVAPTERTPILLVPGGAFGTGEHPTTALCVELLERHVRPDSRWLDVGCGSGILAIVARHCGASSVLAIDDDPEAIAVARKVVKNNATGSGVELAVGSAERYPPGHWNIVCNISAGFLEDSWERFAALLGAADRVVASGFLQGELAGVQASLTAAGLEEVERASRGEWSALVAGRPAGARGGPD